MSASFAYKFALVEWCDAWFTSSLEASTTMIRHTSGWLVHCNKRVVRVAATVDERGPADIMNIPRSLVRKVTVLDAALLKAESASDEIEPPEADVCEALKGY